MAADRLLDRLEPLITRTRVGNAVACTSTTGTMQNVDRSALTPRDREEWGEWSAAEVLWCPLADRDDRVVGILWLARDRPWQKSETVMIQRLAGCYAHAWLALTGGRRP